MEPKEQNAPLPLSDIAKAAKGLDKWFSRKYDGRVVTACYDIRGTKGHITVALKPEADAALLPQIEQDVADYLGDNYGRPSASNVDVIHQKDRGIEMAD